MAAFSALMLLVGRQEGQKTEWWGAGMVICLERGADLHMAQLMPLSLASVKSTLVVPFWYRLTRVVGDKGLLNGCVCAWLACHCRQSLGKVLESLNDHEMAAECLLTSLELEATSPVQPFHVIPRVLS